MKIADPILDRNGHYTRCLDTSVGHINDLPLPRTRGGYQTRLFERYHRRHSELDQEIPSASALTDRRRYFRQLLTYYQ